MSDENVLFTDLVILGVNSAGWPTMFKIDFHFPSKESRAAIFIIILLLISANERWHGNVINFFYSNFVFSAY